MKDDNLDMREMLQYLLLHFDNHIRHTNHTYVEMQQSIVEDSCDNITTNTFNVWKNSSSAPEYKTILHSFLN